MTTLGILAGTRHACISWDDGVVMFFALDEVHGVEISGTVLHGDTGAMQLEGWRAHFIQTSIFGGFFILCISRHHLLHGLADLINHSNISKFAQQQITQKFV